MLNCFSKNLVVEHKHDKYRPFVLLVTKILVVLLDFQLIYEVVPFVPLHTEPDTTQN